MVIGVALDHGGKCYHEECFACKICKESISGTSSYSFNVDRGCSISDNVVIMQKNVMK